MSPRTIFEQQLEELHEVVFGTDRELEAPGLLRREAVSEVGSDSHLVGVGDVGVECHAGRGAHRQAEPRVVEIAAQIGQLAAHA